MNLIARVQEQIDARSVEIARIDDLLSRPHLNEHGRQHHRLMRLQIVAERAALKDMLAIVEEELDHA